MKTWWNHNIHIICHTEQIFTRLEFVRAFFFFVSKYSRFVQRLGLGRNEENFLVTWFKVFCTNVYDVLCDLVPFVKFIKCEKHPWSVTFNKIACFSLLKVLLLLTLLKITPHNGSFSCFLDCTNGTKSRKASHIAIYLTHSWSFKGLVSQHEHQRT